MIIDEGVLERQIQLLRRTRSRLEPVVHSGPAEGRKVWRELEGHWTELDQLRRRGSRDLEEPVGSTRKQATEEIAALRKGYDRLAVLLRRPRSDSRWGQVRVSLDEMVERAGRRSGRVANTLEDLTDAARDRLQKARISRAHLRKRAQLGTRVYELSREFDGLAGGEARLRSDDEVMALLQELGSLDADLERRENLGASGA